MSNLSQSELKLVDTRAKAEENSKGCGDKSLVLNLIARFRLNLPQRSNKNSNTNLIQKQIHLLLAYLKVRHSI
jgi:hypothetical protein